MSRSPFCCTLLLAAFGCTTEPPAPSAEVPSVAGLDVTRTPDRVDAAVDLAASGDALDVSVSAGLLHVEADVDGVVYSLDLEPHALTIVEHGALVRTTVFGFVREGDPNATLYDLVDRFRASGDLAATPEGPLGYPFADSTAHRTVLDALGELVTRVPELAGPLELVGHATAALSTLEATPEELDVLAGIGDPEQDLVPFGDADGDDACIHEAYISKKYSAGSSIDLDAGPVTVSATAAKVSGTSICDPRYSPSADADGDLTGNHSLDGGPDAGCAWGYEAVYTTSGSKWAEAKNGECCQADGVTDSAVIGQLEASVFGKSFDLMAEDSCATDMAKYHRVEITGNSTICLDYTFINEAYLMSSSLSVSPSCH